MVSILHCMLEFEYDYGAWELIIPLHNKGNTCMSLHVTCMLHASLMHWLKAIREHFLCRFLATLTNLSRGTLHASYDDCIEVFQFKKCRWRYCHSWSSISPLNLGVKICINMSKFWQFWCHCFMQMCIHHTMMLCAWLAHQFTEFFNSLISSVSGLIVCSTCIFCPFLAILGSLEPPFCPRSNKDLVQPTWSGIEGKTQRYAELEWSFQRPSLSDIKVQRLVLPDWKRRGHSGAFAKCK